MQIQTNVNLAPFNTFQVPSQAYYFASLNSVTEITEIAGEFRKKAMPVLILGEGANILFTKNFRGLVIKNQIKGRKILSEDSEKITLEVASGENWHDLVMWTVENGLSGIENLALIPGTVGAAPVQNIAAYGQNFAEVVESVTVIDWESGQERMIAKDDCQFYYRDSIFKHEFKDRFVVTAVTITLSKVAHFDTNYHSRYESLKGELTQMGKKPPFSPKDVAEAVINLRMKKLPDWHKIGTAGSFFKNPFVSQEKLAELRKKMPDLQVYPVDNMLYPNPDDPIFKMTDKVKIPAGRLLDELGWKGRRIGNVGTFEKHALVVVAYPGATGQEVLKFTQMMQTDVKKNFGIELQPEVNIL